MSVLFAKAVTFQRSRTGSIGQFRSPIFRNEISTYGIDGVQTLVDPGCPNDGCQDITFRDVIGVIRPLLAARMEMKADMSSGCLMDPLLTHIMSRT